MDDDDYIDEDERFWEKVDLKYEDYVSSQLLGD